jgi:hypothetical protein
MPLNRACDPQAVSDNIRREYKDKGKPHEQAIAIALNVLKRSCGLSPEERKQKLTPKQIVALGQKKEEESAGRCGSVAVSQPKSKSKKKKRQDEEAFGLAGPPKIFSPHRVKKAKRPAPIHRRAKSGREQPFIDPESFTTTRSESMFDHLMAEITEGRNAGRDGAVDRTEFDVDFATDDALLPEQRTTLERFILQKTSKAHQFANAQGSTCVVYHDGRGRAVKSDIAEMEDGELVWLAREKGWKGTVKEAPQGGAEA